MIKEILNYRGGFTVVELIIYMGLLTVLLTVITQMFLSVIDVQLESEATPSIQQDGRFIVARLSHDIKRAEDITYPISLGASGGSLQLTMNSVPYTYSVVSGNLQLNDNTNTDIINSYDSIISGLTFQRLGNAGGDNTIKITFTLTSRTVPKSGPKTQNFETTVGLRQN